LNCDRYGFPCLNCAEFSLAGLLGEGHGNTDCEEDDYESEGCCGDCGDDSSDEDDEDESEPMEVVWEAAWEMEGKEEKGKGKEKAD